MYAGIKLETKEKGWPSKKLIGSKQGVTIAGFRIKAHEQPFTVDAERGQGVDIRTDLIVVGVIIAEELIDVAVRVAEEVVVIEIRGYKPKK